MKDKKEIDPRYRPRRLKCENCGLTLGWIVRRGNVRQLDILRIPASATSTMPNHLSAWVVLEQVGKCQVRCFCDAVREWHVGADAMEQLLKSPEAIKKFRELEGAKA